MSVSLSKPHLLGISQMTQASIQDLGAFYAGLAGVAGTLIGSVVGGRYQAKIAKEQARQSFESQLRMLEKTHTQDLRLLEQQQTREDTLRIRQFAESEKADRLLVQEYIDLLLPRLIQITTIGYLGGDNKDEEEREVYLRLKGFMESNELDAAHPEKNLGVRLTFLLYQLVGAMRLALNARWTRPLTDAQTHFLSYWESQLEPLLCSARYPGDVLLYREQLEIVADEMLSTAPQGEVRRPLNWKEFCKRYECDDVLRELVDIVSNRFRQIFDHRDSRTLPRRRGMQCRLAILALYLINISEDTEDNNWKAKDAKIWKMVSEHYKWQLDNHSRGKGSYPRWFVFVQGDPLEDPTKIS